MCGCLSHALSRLQKRKRKKHKAEGAPRGRENRADAWEGPGDRIQASVSPSQTTDNIEYCLYSYGVGTSFQTTCWRHRGLSLHVYKNLILQIT